MVMLILTSLLVACGDSDEYRIKGPGLQNHALSKVRGYDEASSFSFYLEERSGPLRVLTIDIKSDGKCVYKRKPDMPDETEVHHFTLSAEQLDNLTAFVDKSGFYNLDRGYHSDFSDGTQLKMIARPDEDVKTVYCDNHFPDPVISVYRYLNRNVVPYDIVNHNVRRESKSSE